MGAAGAAAGPAGGVAAAVAVPICAAVAALAAARARIVAPARIGPRDIELDGAAGCWERR